MNVTLKMPLTSNTPWSGVRPFPNDLLGLIDITVDASNFTRKNYVGQYSYDCPSGAFCPKRGEFTIQVPNEGEFTLKVRAKTKTCSSSFYPTCQSKQGNRVGALMSFDWDLTLNAANYQNGGTINLFGDLMGRNGEPVYYVKCCCQPQQIDKMCGVQPNGTAFNSCVPAGFEIDNGYTGVCGADDIDFFCPSTEEKKDINGNCGKPCNDFDRPCTDNNYTCVKVGNVVEGICQLPCSTNSQCPNGQGCNTGWCR